MVVDPGLLGVVDEVALRVVGRVLADDLDGVLVGAHRAIGTEAVEERPDHIASFRGERRDRRRGWYW